MPKRVVQSVYAYRGPRAKTASQARRIVKKLGYHAGKMDKTVNTWRFRQTLPRGCHRFVGTKVIHHRDGTPKAGLVYCERAKTPNGAKVPARAPNPLIITNPLIVTNPPKKRRKKRPKHWHPKGIPIAELPAFFRNDPSYNFALREARIRDPDFQPEYFVPGEAPEGTPAVLAPVGEMEAVAYRRGRHVYEHLGGEQVNGEITTPQVIGWDGAAGFYHFVNPPGSRAHFGPHGMVG